MVHSSKLLQTICIVIMWNSRIPKKHTSSNVRKELWRSNVQHRTICIWQQFITIHCNQANARSTSGSWPYPKMNRITTRYSIFFTLCKQALAWSKRRRGPARSSCPYLLLIIYQNTRRSLLPSSRSLQAWRNMKIQPMITNHVIFWKESSRIIVQQVIMLFLWDVRCTRILMTFHV